MNIFREYHAVVTAELEHIRPGLDGARFTVEPPRDPKHGDVSTNAALVLAKAAGTSPRDLAAALAERLGARPEVEAAEVAGPGFVNLRLADGFWRARLAEILRAGESYGDSTLGAGRRINVEYVSANPTGPMHVGHGRGAVVGDALASLLEKAGYEVTREYYINDAGVQVDQLAYAAYFRYLEALGLEATEETFRALFPGRDWEYRGDYLSAVGERLKAAHRAALADTASGAPRPLPEEAWIETVRTEAVGAMMEGIRADLAALGIRHAVFTSERALQEAGAIARVVDDLAARDLVYTGTPEPPKGKLPEDWEPRPQLLFRATRFGDDVDRPLKKSDGSWTYFASDIAYHRDKFDRGFEILVDVWGADHKGYVRRMQAAVEAVTEGKATLDVRLCNLVNLLEAGQPVRMSKRAGAFVTLREVIDRVGRDVVRFIMLTRSNEAPLDFDLARVVEQSKDNPVFYVQYAHARACSVLRNAAEAFADRPLDDSYFAESDLSPLRHPAELALIRQLAGWPRLVESAAESHEPTRVAYYLSDLAAAFHGLWTLGNDDPGLRFLLPDAPALSLARLALVRAVAVVVASGLKVMGVQPVEEMR